MKAFGYVWVAFLRTKRRLSHNSIVLQDRVWLLGLVKRPARGYTCHDILLQGAVMAYS